MSERLAGSTGTSLTRGTEARFSRTLPALFLPVAVLGVALALVPLWLGDSRVQMGVAILGLAFACYTIAFNVIFGSTGQLFLCVGALAGIGGYGASILADKGGLPIAVSIVVATVAATITGGLLSFVAVRRSLGVIFTGIVTLIFSLSFENLLLGRSDLTGGDTGRLIDSGADTFLREQIPPYYLMLALVLVYLLIHGLLRRSHIGWAFRALRDDEVAARLSGVDVARYRRSGQPHYLWVRPGRRCGVGDAGFWRYRHPVWPNRWGNYVRLRRRAAHRIRKAKAGCLRTPRHFFVSLDAARSDPHCGLTVAPCSRR
jgi:uncharacterized membrane protein YjjB (DUF3815 family)